MTERAVHHLAVAPPAGEEADLPPELVAERRRIRRLSDDADRRSGRGRLRRRSLLPTAVASGVLAGTGLIGVWARSTSPAPAASAAATAPAAATSRSATAALEKLRKEIDAERAAIAALPQAAATSLAGPASTAGGSPPAAAPSAPTPALPSLPPISVPTISAPPATHATTGASGLG